MEKPPLTFQVVDNRIGMVLNVGVASEAEALARMRELGEKGFAPPSFPAGGHILPYCMADNFDFRLIGARWFTFEKLVQRGTSTKKVPVQCVEHGGMIYTRRDYTEEDDGQQKGAKIKYSRGARVTDPPEIREGAKGENKGYVTLVQFVGNGRSIKKFEKPDGARAAQPHETYDDFEPDADPEPAAQPATPSAVRPAAAAAPATAAPADAAPRAASPSAAVAAPPAARPLHAVPPKIDLVKRWTALGRKREDITPWLASIGVTIAANTEPNDEQKRIVHEALLRLEGARNPSPIERWKALGNDVRGFVGWVRSLGIALPENGGIFDAEATATISRALGDLEADRAALLEFEDAANQ